MKSKIILKHIINRIVSITIRWPIKSSRYPWTSIGFNNCIVPLKILSIKFLVISERSIEDGAKLLIPLFTSLTTLSTVDTSTFFSYEFNKEDTSLSLTFFETSSILGQLPVFRYSVNPHINLLKPTEFSKAEW